MESIAVKSLIGTNWKDFKKQYDKHIKRNIRCIQLSDIKHVKNKGADIWSVKFKEDLSI